MLVLFLVAAVPLAAFAAGQLDLQLTQPAADEHAPHEHYGAIGAVALAPVVAGAVAASGVVGWRITEKPLPGSPRGWVFRPALGGHGRPGR